MVIRNAVEKDLDALVRLERDCFDTPWDGSAIREALVRPPAYGMVAVQEGSLHFPSGALLFRIVADEMEILRIAVARSFRRRGIASRLLERGVALAAEKGASACFLEVRSSNAAAVGLYERLGFRGVGRRSGYYAASGEDALVLKKEIHPTNERRTG